MIGHTENLRCHQKTITTDELNKVAAFKKKKMASLCSDKFLRTNHENNPATIPKIKKNI